MSNLDRNAAVPGFSANGATTMDVGLRAFMLRVYNYMAAGVGLTGVAAFLTYQFTGPELLQSPLMWVFILAPLGLVIVDHFPHLHAVLDHAGVLYLGGSLRRA
jgi:FtsH-binding integral membrane protein